jgi:MtrB/PioB family decaheme-associated outer membrane protein
VVAPGCRGTTGISTGWALLMLPEPINSNHSQVEARLNYAGTKLRLSGGYYGSFFSNVNAALSPNVPSSLNNPVGTLLPLNTGLQAILNLPLALAPDNQAHQLDLTGLYSLTPTTQLNFKLGYSQALQHQNFAASGFTGAPAGVSDLGGKVSTTLALAGITSRPVHKLSLRADIRFEEKDDQTPIALYNIEDKSTYTNRQIPNTKVRAKAQADYQFTSEMRGTLGVDFESIDRGVFTATSALSGISALRQVKRSVDRSVSRAVGATARTGSRTTAALA